MSLIPYKNTSLAILFGVILGPIGLLYGSLILACPLIVLGLFVVGRGLFLPAVLLWLISTILNVFAVERYNRKLLKLQVELLKAFKSVTRTQSDLQK